MVYLWQLACLFSRIKDCKLILEGGDIIAQKSAIKKVKVGFGIRLNKHETSPISYLGAFGNSNWKLLLQMLYGKTTHKPGLLNMSNKYSILA